MIDLLRASTLAVFVAMSFMPSTFALEEVILDEEESAQDVEIEQLSLTKYDKDYDFTTSVVERSSEILLSDNANLRLAQAANMLASSVIELCNSVVSNEENQKIALNEDSEGEGERKTSESTFVGRIFKEEDRYKPLQVFNKNGYFFEKGPFKSLKMAVFYAGTNTLSWPYRDRVTSKWKDNAVEVTAIAKFRNDKTAIRFTYNFLRDIQGHPSGLMERVSELGIVHEFNKNQQVHIGQTWRLPIGYEGYTSLGNQDLPEKAMIARTFSDTRSFGVRNIANYKYVDYDIGLYDSTRYWQKFGNGLDFTGWVNFKPLANLNIEKYGKLTIGGGVSAGKNDDSYCVSGAFLGYRYKKLYNKFEYAYANGYNGTTTQSTAKAEGFYDTLIYDITDKVSLIGRFDYFNPNTALRNNIKTEYVAGLSYKINSCLKLLTSYTYSKISDGNYGHKVSILAILKI